MYFENDLLKSYFADEEDIVYVNLDFIPQQLKNMELTLSKIFCHVLE
jgi:hypothetical protein